VQPTRRRQVVVLGRHVTHQRPVLAGARPFLGLAEVAPLERTVGGTTTGLLALFNEYGRERRVPL
jgi:hypothetical protein